MCISNIAKHGYPKHDMRRAYDVFSKLIYRLAGYYCRDSNRQCDGELTSNSVVSLIRFSCSVCWSKKVFRWYEGRCRCALINYTIYHDICSRIRRRACSMTWTSASRRWNTSADNFSISRNSFAFLRSVGRPPGVKRIWLRPNACSSSQGTYWSIEQLFNTMTCT
jgi:hypothetical protein